MSPDEDSAASINSTGQLRHRNDDSLIPYLQKGVRHAVSELERRYGDPLRRRATRLLSDPAMAEDMVQDIMLRCCGADDAKLPERQLRAWLYRSLRNRCTDELRKRRVRVARRIDDGAPSMIGDMPIDPLTSPGSKAIKFEQASALMHLIDGFEDDMREVLVMRYFENRSRGEISEELGISESVVKVRLVKAVASLRRKLASIRDASKA